MAEIRFPNGRMADLPIDPEHFWVKERKIPEFVMTQCRFTEGTPAERADRFFAWMDQVGPEAAVNRALGRLEKYEVSFPNGKSAAFNISLRDVFYNTTEEGLPMFVCRLCGFIEGSETERSDKLFELIEKIGADAVSDKVMDNNEVFIEARREGFEIDDKYKFH